MTPAKTAAQLYLAAEILETGHPFEWRNEDFSEWHTANGNSVHHFMDNCVIRPVLARPPYKAKLHNPNGLNAEQVGVGYRLAIVNEPLLQDFYEYWGRGSKSWSKGCFNKKARGICTYRLPLSVPWPEQPKPFTLPIQTFAQDQVELTSEMQDAASQVLKEEMQGLDPYADLKKANAEGKVIETKCSTIKQWVVNESPDWTLPVECYRIKPDENPWTEWHGGPCPLKDEEVEEFEFKIHTGTSGVLKRPSVWRWSLDGNKGDIIAYRVLKWREKKPKVPLGPEDVTPFTRLRVKVQSPDYRFISWIAPLSVNQDGILVAARSNVVEISWETLKLDYERNDSLETGKWDINAWEACEK